MNILTWTYEYEHINQYDSIPYGWIQLALIRAIIMMMLSQRYINSDVQTNNTDAAVNQVMLIQAWSA